MGNAAAEDRTDDADHESALATIKPIDVDSFTSGPDNLRLDHPMLITKMRSRECREMLSRLSFGRLACASNNRPYIVPLYYSFDADRLCCFSTLGRKIEWMRLNPLVCVQVDEISAHDEWTSIVVLGQYVEIPNGREFAKSREQIRTLLEKRSLWWQSGYTASQVRRKLKPPIFVFFFIRIEQITGLRATPDTREEANRRVTSILKSRHLHPLAGGAPSK